MDENISRHCFNLSFGNHCDQSFHGFKFQALDDSSMLLSSVQTLAVASPVAFGENKVEHDPSPVVKVAKEPKESADLQ